MSRNISGFTQQDVPIRQRGKEYDPENPNIGKSSYGPGMQELATIVAGLSKDIKYLRNTITKQGADNYTSSKKGWNAHEKDIIGGPEKEVFITNPQGKIVVLNGWKLAPSKQYQRKNLKLYNDVNPEYKKTLSDTNAEAEKVDFNNQTQQFDWHYEPGLPPEIQRILISKRKKEKPTNARKIFRSAIWNPVWAGIRSFVLDDLKNANITQGKQLKIMSQLFREAYFNYVVAPVAMNDFNIDLFPGLTTKEINDEIKKASIPKELFDTKLYNRVVDLYDDEHIANEIIDFLQAQLPTMITSTVAGEPSG